jgi:hypothetical protein
MSERLDAGDDLVVVAHGLVECYSVLTRLPPPHRIYPSVASELLEQNLTGPGRVVGLPVREYWSLVRRAPGIGVAGGRIHDAVIAAAAARGGAGELLTLNPSHFEGLLPEGIEVVSP